MIKFTRHAEEMLLQRGIEKKKVLGCLKNPDIKSAGVNGTLVFLKDYVKNYLKVIFVRDLGDDIVITLYWIDKKRVKR